VREAGGWSEPWEVRVTADEPADVERLLDYMASFSWIAAMEEQQRARLLAEIDALLRAGSAPPRMPVHAVIGLASLT
jgi:hypothetical protein